MSPEVVEWFAKNWAALSAAPAAFVSLAVIAAGFGYIVGTYFKNGEASSMI
jgi:hypothetical protein